MPWKLTNVALDPAYAMKRRTAHAAKLEMEPVIAGSRLRLRQVVTISDELYKANEARITQFEKMGVLKVEGQGEPKKFSNPVLAKVTKEPVLPTEPEPDPAPSFEPFNWEEPPAEEPDTEPATPKTKKSKKSKK